MYNLFTKGVLWKICEGGNLLHIFLVDNKIEVIVFLDMVDIATLGKNTPSSLKTPLEQNLCWTHRISRGKKECVSFCSNLCLLFCNLIHKFIVHDSTTREAT